MNICVLLFCVGKKRIFCLVFSVYFERFRFATIHVTAKTKTRTTTVAATATITVKDVLPARV